MKFLALTILMALAAPLSGRAQGPTAAAGAKDAHDAVQTGVERRTAAPPDATVSLCLGAGSVVVRGWDRAEVQARSAQAGRIELRQTGKGIDVLVSDEEGEHFGPCNSTSDVELDVPRGASVTVKVREGDVDVSGVAELRAESLNGDVDARRIARVTEVSCLSGDVSLSDSKGRARLRSVSGSVDVMNVAPSAAGDDLVAHSTSGDVSLERVSHASVKGMTTSGSVRMSGALAAGGSYEFATHSGDVTMSLPPDSAFRVNARVVFSGEIVTDFPITGNMRPPSAPSAPSTEDAAEPPDPPSAPGPGPTPGHPHGHGKVKVKVKAPKAPPQHTTLVGTVGRGGADLKLTSFSGTVYLKKE